MGSVMNDMITFNLVGLEREHWCEDDFLDTPR